MPKKKPGLKTTLVRTISFWYNKIKNAIGLFGAANSYILPGLYLGMIPHNGTKEIMDFVMNHQDPQSGSKVKPLGLVVSVVEEDELAGDGFLFVKMVQPQEWEQAGVKHIRLNMADFTATVDSTQAINVIIEMRKQILDGNAVFVHCKAGRARSAMLCAVYISLFEHNPITRDIYDIEKAVAFLKEKRSQVDVKPGIGQKQETAELIRLACLKDTRVQQLRTNNPHALYKEVSTGPAFPLFKSPKLEHQTVLEVPLFSADVAKKQMDAYKKYYEKLSDRICIDTKTGGLEIEIKGTNLKYYIELSVDQYQSSVFFTAELTEALDLQKALVIQICHDAAQAATTAFIANPRAIVTFDVSVGPKELQNDMYQGFKAKLYPYQDMDVKPFILADLHPKLLRSSVDLR